MRVIVAEDVLITRQGIVHMLESSGIEVVAEAEDASGLLESRGSAAAGRGRPGHPHAAHAHR